MKKLITRTLAGIVYIAIIVAALTLGKWWFILLLVLLSLGGVREVEKMAAHLTSVPKLVACWDGLTAAILICSVTLEVSGLESSVPPLLLLLPALICIMIRAVMQLYIKNASGIICIAVSAFSLLYVAGALSTLPMIYYIYGSPMLILAMFILIWLNDTGAFVVGSLMGKHRLFERLSPKKSWEGFFGGMLFSILAGGLMWYWLPEWMSGLSLAASLGMGALVSVMATWGDLFESMLKRTADVKDSGHLIPGHGGVMDRIDSLLFVSPAVLIYLVMVANF